MDYNEKIQKIVENVVSEFFDAQKLTKLQKETIDDLEESNATSKETATVPNNWKVGENLAKMGILNTTDTNKYWIRQNGEEATGLMIVFMIYGLNIKIDGKVQNLVFCKYDGGKYSWKNIQSALTKLARQLGVKATERILIEGYDLDFYNRTKFPKFEFNGSEFIKK